MGTAQIQVGVGWVFKEEFEAGKFKTARRGIWPCVAEAEGRNIS